MKETQKQNIKVKRLGFSYGYKIYDGDTLVWKGKSRKEAIKNKKYLEDGGDPNNLQSEELVFPSRIIKFEEKHLEVYYSIPTHEDLKKLALKTIKERKNYFFKPTPPKEIDITEDVIETLPDSMKNKAQLELKRYKRDLRDYNIALQEYDIFQKALDGNETAALYVLQSRNDYGHQYETYEIIDPQTV